MAEEEIDTQLERCKMMSNSQIGARFWNIFFGYRLLLLLLPLTDNLPPGGLSFHLSSALLLSKLSRRV